jgi:3-methyladenine DNA glycosylase Tag
MVNSFAEIYARAVENKGGVDALESILPHAKSAQELAEIPNDRYLAEMTRCVFRAGFVWKIVESKWPDFETAFKRFNPRVNAAMSNEFLEQLASDPSIIRNYQKIQSVRDNACLVLEVSDEYGSFGECIGHWPLDDIVRLFMLLKKRGSRLGGHTGQYFLRFMGKDTFIFSKDVVKVLVDQGVVSKEPTSQKDLQSVQHQFNRWREETGRPLCQLSRIMAASVV